MSMNYSIKNSLVETFIGILLIYFRESVRICSGWNENGPHRLKLPLVPNRKITKSEEILIEDVRVT